MITVLIIDDQISVVNGIRSGVRWREIGVDRVFEAYHVAGAKRIMKKNKVDILLCDIEMPAEDGISLLRWVREHGYPAECIFLTAHAEFSFAREALRLGSVDYIIQPARYEDIQQVLGNTVKKIRESRRKAEYYNYGKLLSQKKMMVQDGIFSELLNGAGKDVRQLLEDCKKLSIPLRENSAIYLVKIVLRDKLEVLGKGELRRHALSNIMKEMASDYGQEAILTGSEENAFMLLVFQAENRLIDKMGLHQLLHEFVDQCRTFYQIEMACYVGKEGLKPENINKCAEELNEMARNNVVGEIGIFESGVEVPRPGRTLPYFQKQKYIDFIAKGYIQNVKTDIICYLEKLKVAGAMDASRLNRCYQDFQEVLYYGGEKNKIAVADILQNSSVAERMGKANTSLECLESYIDEVLNFYEKSIQKEKKDKTQIDKIIEYIQCNIEKELKRQEIAEALHLNPDYISRIFTQAMGKSLKSYIIEEKMQLAKILLKTTPLAVGDIAIRVGYTNFSHFSQNYKKVMGKLPIEERKGE